MKHVLDLQLGYTDAENYRRPENKEMFNRVFIRNEHLDRLCQHAISFLIGEKGTGKTAYAVFLANNDYKATRGSTRETSGASSSGSIGATASVPSSSSRSPTS